MKFFRNKFFLSIITIIFLLFSLQFYFISSSYKIDTNSYITLISWAGKISRNIEDRPIILEMNVKQEIKNGDIVNTIWESLAVIEWWDKSITRLWSNSKILIKENFVSDDLSKINISFELLKWKSWSNVIPIMLPYSYFKQDINWTTAAVRWTIFEVDYDKDYIQVHSHQVKVTNTSWEEKDVYPWVIFSLKSFSLEEIKGQIDEAFIKLNENLDKEYLKNLRENFLSSFQKTNPLNIIWKFSSENKVYSMLISGEKEKLEKYISSLPEDKKQKIINKLVSLSQSINFENGEDSSLYNLKLNTRSLIIDNSWDSNFKEIFKRYNKYDLESVKSKLLEIDANGKKILNTGLNKILEIYKK